MKASTHPASIKIQAEHMILRGVLEIPANARAIIVFAHGHDSNNLSPRNRLVARSLLQRGFAILQPDLTSEAGDRSDPAPRHERGGILQTANRLVAVIDWLTANPWSLALD